MGQAGANVFYPRPCIQMPTSIVTIFRVNWCTLTQQAFIVLARAAWRIVKKESDVTTSVKQVMGKKPHKICIKARDDVDKLCEGKILGMK